MLTVHCVNKWLFFAISHLAIIMKSDHHQQQTLISQLYTMGYKRMLGSKTCFTKCNFFLGTVQHLMSHGEEEGGHQVMSLQIQ